MSENHVPYLSTVVSAVFGDYVVDLRFLDGAEHQGLSVVFGPVIQVKHPHPGEVDPVRVERLKVHVVHHVLEVNNNNKKNKQKKSLKIAIETVVYCIITFNS